MKKGFVTKLISLVCAALMLCTSVPVNVAANSSNGTSTFDIGYGTNSYTMISQINSSSSFLVAGCTKAVSSNKSIVSIKRSGNRFNITPKKKGKTTITFYKKKKTIKKIYLLVIKPSDIKYNDSTITLKKGKSTIQAVKLAGYVKKAGVTVKYSSSNSKVAKVSSKGKITAVKAGTASIKTKVYYKKKCVKTYSKAVQVLESNSLEEISIGSSQVTIENYALKADAMLKKAFTDLGFRLSIVPEGSISASGVFDSASRSLTISSTASYKVVYHELGHFLSFMSATNDHSQKFITAYNTEKEKYSSFDKAYITQRSSEYFAQSYADYIFSKDDLKKNRPLTYACIESALSEITDARINTYKVVYGPYWK